MNEYHKKFLENLARIQIESWNSRPDRPRAVAICYVLEQERDDDMISGDAVLLVEGHKALVVAGCLLKATEEALAVHARELGGVDLRETQ